MDIKVWRQILLLWINGLGLLASYQTQIHDFKSSLSDGEVIKKIIQFLNKYRPKKKSKYKELSSNEEYIEDFFKVLPNLIGNNPLDLNNEEDLTIIISCLLYLGSVTFEVSEVRTNLMVLDTNLQTSITIFLDTLVKLNNIDIGLITRSVISDAVLAIPDCNLVEAGLSSDTPKKTPLSSFTNKNQKSSSTSPINEFFQSPTIQKKAFTDKLKEIAMLKGQLQEGEEEIDKLIEKIRKLEQINKELNGEIKVKNLELRTNLYENQSLLYKLEMMENARSDKSDKTDIHMKEKFLEDEIKFLESARNDLHSEMENLQKKLSTANQQLNDEAEQKKLWIAKFYKLEDHCKELKQNNDKQTEQNLELEEICECHIFTINNLKLELKHKESMAQGDKPQSLYYELQTVKLAELTNELEQQRENHAAQAKKFARLSQDMDSKLKIITAENHSLIESLKMKETEIAKSEAEISRLEEDINEKKSLADLFSLIETSLAEISVQVLQLQEVIEDNETTLIQITNEKQLQADLLDQTKSELKTSNEKCEWLMTELKRILAERDQLRDENNGEKIKQMYENRLQSLKRQMITEDQAHIAELSSQLWDTSEKLLLVKVENKHLKALLSKTKTEVAIEMAPPLRKWSRAKSDNQINEVASGSRYMQEESTGSSTGDLSQARWGRAVPAGLGKVFPAEDEEDEVFDNSHLADVMSGRCTLPSTDLNRLSTLQYRNSLCPPHLKSSYPAETQFLDTSHIREEDIKGGLNVPDASDRRRSRSQGNESISRQPLRESNSQRDLRANTPSRLRALFPSRRRDENSPGGRRLSFFRKKS